MALRPGGRFIQTIQRDKVDQLVEVPVEQQPAEDAAKLPMTADEQVANVGQVFRYMPSRWFDGFAGTSSWFAYTRVPILSRTEFASDSQMLEESVWHDAASDDVSWGGGANLLFLSPHLLFHDASLPLAIPKDTSPAALQVPEEFTAIQRQDLFPGPRCLLYIDVRTRGVILHVGLYGNDEHRKAVVRGIEGQIAADARYFYVDCGPYDVAAGARLVLSVTMPDCDAGVRPKNKELRWNGEHFTDRFIMRPASLFDLEGRDGELVIEAPSDQKAFVISFFLDDAVGAWLRPARKPAPPNSVFISYRHVGAHPAAAIAQRLQNELGEAAVFFDSRSIVGGDDWKHRAAGCLRECGLVIAVVCKDWLGVEQERIRIQDDDDPVRFEIETALQRRTKIFPVLVDGATMPMPNQLPDTLLDFQRLAAFEYRAGTGMLRDLDHISEAARSELFGRGSLDRR